MVSTTLKKRAPRKQNPDLIKDLDLDVPVVDDVAIVHNHKRAGLKAAYRAADIDDDDDYVALPQEAHERDDDGPTTLDDIQEEAEMAIKISHRHRRALHDDDFGVEHIPEPDHTAPSATRQPAAAAGTAEPTLEEVERDFAKLTADERLAMLTKESPEVLALLKELGGRVEAAAALSADLKQARFHASKSGRDQELVDFLEVKTALMLTYCAHVTFYLLLKAEGSRVQNHPVVDRLVELRVYMEKLRPVEQRMQYSLTKLLAGESAGGPKLSDLRAPTEFEADVFQANKLKAVDDGRAAKRKAIARLAQQEELQHEEEQQMTRAMRKGIMRDGDLELIQAADTGMTENQDQFLSRAVEYDSDDDSANEQGLSLVEKLRRRVGVAALTANGKSGKKRETRRVSNDVAVAEEGDGSEEGDDVVNYDALLEEERVRQAADGDAARHATAGAAMMEAEEVERRNIDYKILTHRGLTKVRPKKSRNPRVNRRTKAKKGEADANAQSRSSAKRPERDSDFVGVPAIKTHITHTNRLS